MQNLLDCFDNHPVTRLEAVNLIWSDKKVTLSGFAKKCRCYPQWIVHPKPMTVKPHGHDFLEIVIVSQGETIHMVDGREYRTRPGNVIFLNRCREHTYRSEKGTVGIFNLMFYPDVWEPVVGINDQDSRLYPFKKFEPFFNSRFSYHATVQLDERALKRILSACSYLRHVFLKSEDPTLIRRLFSSVLDLLYTEYKPLTEGVQGYPEEITRVLNYIEQNTSSNISLSDLAKHVQWSKSYLSSQFKKIVGRSLTEYINHIRIEKAKHLLKMTTLPIIDVALTLGYNDISHFNHTFKKHLGTPPSKYRESVNRVTLSSHL